jgi:hypothetical protein
MGATVIRHLSPILVRQITPRTSANLTYKID